ncbi:cyclic nucleotide-binding domain-containing protein [Myxococcota bacterium]|nr:cyclic nucleotide-binding domain-containing protein [Myxococcota bacterium]
MEEGESSQGRLYFLSRGSLEVVKGDDISIAVLTEPGSVVGEISVLLGTTHSASVRAIETSSCFVADDGESFLRDHPEASLVVGRLLARRLYMATTYLADIKRQYADHDASLAMVDEVLETFVHHQDDGSTEAGSDREREPNY